MEEEKEGVDVTLKIHLTLVRPDFGYTVESHIHRRNSEAPDHTPAHNFFTKETNAWIEEGSLYHSFYSHVGLPRGEKRMCENPTIQYAVGLLHNCGVWGYGALLLLFVCACGLQVLVLSSQKKAQIHIFRRFRLELRVFSKPTERNINVPMGVFLWHGLEALQHYH